MVSTTTPTTTSKPKPLCSYCGAPISSAEVLGQKVEIRLAPPWGGRPWIGPKSLLVCGQCRAHRESPKPAAARPDPGVYQIEIRNADGTTKRAEAFFDEDVWCVEQVLELAYGDPLVVAVGDCVVNLLHCPYCKKRHETTKQAANCYPSCRRAKHGGEPMAE